MLLSEVIFTTIAISVNIEYLPKDTQYSVYKVDEFVLAVANTSTAICNTVTAIVALAVAVCVSVSCCLVNFLAFAISANGASSIFLSLIHI